ncbi:SAM-dependent methyltransferase [Nocardia takedensis]|uniref:SAM-dependent methyltransferase n=1 Tax=Nocardia takedensis TaxID=259390 RepID=UPI0003005E3E|nr:class I SAM-dependent methyltransferase [Nocardia takedensis]
MTDTTTHTSHTHDHDHNRGDGDQPADPKEFWEGFYRERGQIWTGDPNPLLVREASDLPPGAALDLGCGEGGDAVWLAARGWRVTAVDIAATALSRAAAHAEQAGVRDRITFAEHDLNVSFPEGEFDLVSAQFFHSPVAQEAERSAVLRRAAEAVAVDGVLLVAGHAGWPSFVEDPPHPDVHFPTVEEVLRALDLPEDRWTVEASEEVHREVTWPDGKTGIRADNILRLRRRA